ncbi:MAG: hypothetical protein R3C53_18485 [Pirellulaceae bacterium]
MDRTSGTELWKQRWEGAMSVPFFAKSNGDWIRSTPATDGKHVVVGHVRRSGLFTPLRVTNLANRL